MVSPRPSSPTDTAGQPPSASKPAGPGRPKDLSKRNAILEAAKRLFLIQGYDGVSMDQIAAEAGVSKLTVYSHFGDKETLFAAAVRAHCEQHLPPQLFAPEPGTPLRERLLAIAQAFFDMAAAPEAIRIHRLLCTPQLAQSPLTQLFWDVGPHRLHEEFAGLLRRRSEAGELALDDADTASRQFFAVLKGEPYALLMLGYPLPGEAEIRAHLEASVDMFLRAYARGER
ncbi:TetR/AcrR family transcriptional regulator [Lysobacter enzymogenes]|uniref:TetR/AcrR family transcriptional regulator n=1 Tax=Lysobacter enzymogenes TaxID=69 RepID=UPI00089C5464|nr:TetR/AcrR family transcriptional regulator [Lysobacter enzymogenes]SDY15073.1 TetR/AcrR family transcriptional regulator, mexJK operon transcriptional repressor [Lysobacter enzymogenes]